MNVSTSSSFTRRTALCLVIDCWRSNRKFQKQIGAGYDADEGTTVDGLFAVGLGIRVALTALVFSGGCGTGIPMAAASGGSSSGAAWKCASAIAVSLAAISILPFRFA
jgi:hypothetical protein